MHKGARDQERAIAMRAQFGHHAADDVGQWVLELDDAERRTMAMLAERVGLTSTPLADPETLLTVHCLSGLLPERLIRRLHAFRKWSNDRGTLLLRGLPMDAALPVTPTDERSVPARELPVASGAMLLVMGVMGDFISYHDEKGGELIQDVHPVQNKASLQENTGSVYLEFHTEDGFHPYKPDVIGLMGIRQDHDKIAKTATACIRRGLPLLSSSTIETLRRADFRLRISSSFGGGGYSPRLAVLSGDLARPDLCVDYHLMEPLTDRAALALEQLRGALEQVAVGVAVQPGDMIMVDNRTTIHARTAFLPRYDGKDRWLRRMFAVVDLRKSQPARSDRSHVCAPLSLLNAIETEVPA